MLCGYKLRKFFIIHRCWVDVLLSVSIGKKNYVSLITPEHWNQFYHEFFIILPDFGKEEQTQAENKEQQPPANSTQANNNSSLTNNERPSKRQRRTRNDAFSGLENNHNESAPVEHVLRSQVPSSTSSGTVQKKSTTGMFFICFFIYIIVLILVCVFIYLKNYLYLGKKKKRKSRQAAQAQKEESPPREEEPAIDPDEPTYCLCDQISYGEMIMCDNDLCPIEWFHFSCVTLTTKPKGKWYCPKCRGDRPNVMKPKAQFLRELEKYNKEKEEKT